MHYFMNLLDIKEHKNEEKILTKLNKIQRFNKTHKILKIFIKN